METIVGRRSDLGAWQMVRIGTKEGERYKSISARSLLCTIPQWSPRWNGHLIEQGRKLSLDTAVCLDMPG